MANTRDERIREIVRRIPAGRVSTYGAVARRIGGCTARMVGAAMSALPDDSGVPWHRVINSQGRISVPGETGRRQRALLEAEGVEFDDRGRVDLAAHGWGSADSLIS